MNANKKGKNYQGILLLALVVVISLVGCNNQPESKTATAEFNKIDSLRATFLTIEDSLVHTWNVMINDDNKKIKSLKRLVEEVVYAGGVDSTITQSLLLRIKELKSERYSCKTMSDSDLIDSYDSISNALVNDIINLATAHEEFGRNIVMNELIDEINEAEGKILFFRIDYDDVAKMYNQFLEQNQAYMSDIESKNNLKKIPIFELPSDQ